MAKPVMFTVDDDPEVLRASGRSALDTLGEFKLRNDAVALFLVDQRMPRMTGVEFLEEALSAFPEAHHKGRRQGDGARLGHRPRLVVGRHGGDVRVDPKPGETRMKGRLPLNPRQQNGG